MNPELFDKTALISGATSAASASEPTQSNH
jgi:hypothetical protein